MVWKPPKISPRSLPRPNQKVQRGFTLVEVLIIVVILVIILAVVLLNIDVPTSYKKARDEKRLTDLATLDRVISDYFTDIGVYPDMVSTLRTSATLPVGASADLANPHGGWILADLAGYTPRLPLDPLNTGVYVYQYKRDNYGYEVTCVLEYYTQKMTTDGGNDLTVFEVGTNLSIL